MQIMQNKKIIIALGITFALVLFVSIAFAALAAQLNISFGNVTQNALSWNIGFKGSSVTPTADGTSSTGLSCGVASVTPSTVTISDSTLSKPGDKCTYPLTIENKGDISATLSNIATTSPTDVSCNVSGSTMVCGNVTYKLTTISGSELITGVTINKNDEYNINLIVSYTGEELNDEPITQRNAKFTLTYTQSSNRTTLGNDVPEGITQKVCKRATSLHTEECERTNGGCYDKGYYLEGEKNTTTIKYGSLGTSGNLTSGDAFDCDVNGDGTYDPTSERFYYVSQVDGDNNNTYAAFIYYTNVYNGVADNLNTAAYNSTAANYNGPATAYLQLPTNSQWPNVNLSSNVRQIYAQNGTTATTGGTLPQFTYENRAARLLSYKEVNKACNVTIGSSTTGELDNCEYLLEHTFYSTGDYDVNTPDYWLETPLASLKNPVWMIFGLQRSAATGRASMWEGIRPVIEVPLKNIDY